MATDYAAMGAGVNIGTGIVSTIGSLYMQREQNKAQLRQLNTQLANIHTTMVRNEDTLDTSINIIKEATVKSKWEIAKQSLTASGTAKVRAAQLGVSSEGQEETELTIQRKTGLALADVTKGQENAISNLRQNLEQTNQSLQDSIYGINTSNIHAVDYSAAVLQLGGVAVDALNYKATKDE